MSHNLINERGFIERDVKFNPVLTNFDGLPSLPRYQEPRGRPGAYRGVGGVTPTLNCATKSLLCRRYARYWVRLEGRYRV